MLITGQMAAVNLQAAAFHTFVIAVPHILVEWHSNFLLPNVDRRHLYRKLAKELRSR